MRYIALAVLLAAAAPAMAEDRSQTAPPNPGPLTVSVSYSLNAPLTSTAPEDVAEQDRSFRRAMYERAVGECEDLLATIAASCTIGSINVSSQVNVFPGQPPTIYVSTNVSMQVTRK